jgi:microcystin-dependent protein
MAQPFIGQVIVVGFNFAPVGWAACNGQSMSIAQNSTLFQLLGTTFGGDGVQTFNLPDLRGRIALNQGQAPGLQNYIIGQMGGVESVTPLLAQTPSHTHTLTGATSGGASDPATNTVLGTPASPAQAYAPAGTATATALASASISASAGSGNQPHENRQPLLTMNYIISLFGIFPSQS